MIRINLLPIKQDRRREAGRNQLIIGFLFIAVEIVGFVLLHMALSADLDEQRNKNDIIQDRVKRIEKQLKDHKKILKEIEEFEKRQEAIDNLKAARTGPIFVMLELSRVLSKDGRPHMDRDEYLEMIQINPAAGYDESWDSRRVWVTSFKEKSRDVKIKGQGLTHEDVAEFLRRINLSDFFVSTELVSTKLGSPKVKMGGFSAKKSDTVVHFAIDAKVKYK